jgi:hypothetical protein
VTKVKITKVNIKNFKILNLEYNSKASMKHSQSVLQFKDRHKIPKRILRLEIDPYDSNTTEVKTNKNSYVATTRSITNNTYNKENDGRAINNLKTAKRNHQSNNNIQGSKAVTPRNMKYPPKQPSDVSATNKSCNFIVNNPCFTGRPCHRRNISSGYYQYPKNVTGSRNDLVSNQSHGSLLQYNRSPLRLVDQQEEASNFNLDEIDEANDKSITFEDSGTSVKSKNVCKYLIFTFCYLAKTWFL